MGQGSELTARRKDGTEFPAEITLSYIATEGGPTATVFVSDITERKRRELALRESEARVTMAMEASAAGAWSWDARTNQWQWDERYHRMYGLSSDVPPSFETWAGLLHPADKPRVLARIGGVRNTPGDDRWDLEFRALLPDGRVRWMQGLGSAERNAGGELLAFRGINIDITDRKLKEEALRESEESLRVLLDRSSAGVAMLDREMRYRYANERWKKDYGLTGDVAGRSHYELFPEIPERWNEIHRRAFAGESSRADEDPFQRKDGRAQWIRWEVLPWHRPTGEVGGIFIVAEDITERKLAQEALATSEQRFRLATDATGAGTFDFDPVQRRAVCSQQIFMMLGLPMTAHIDLDTLVGLIHPEDRPGFEQELLAALGPASSGRHEHEFRVIRPDGITRWIRDVGRAFYEGEGAERRPVRLIGTAIDITDRKLAEEALRVSNERFSLISRGTNDGLWDWDLVNNTVFRTERWLDLLGHKDEELPLAPEDWASRLHPDDHDRATDAVREHLQDRKPYDVEYRLRRKDGTYRWFHDRGQAVWDSSGRPLRMVGSISDVTERVELKLQLEEALRRTDDELTAIIDSAPLAILTVDRDARVTTWNSAAERIFGYRAAEAIGRISPAVPAADIGAFRGLLSRTLSGESMRAQGLRQRRDGTSIAVSLSLAPLHDAQGAVRGAIVMAEDVTPRTKAEAELTRVRAALASAREDEARRIARELHDDTSQQLAMLSVDLGKLAMASPEVASHIEPARDRLLGTMEGIRALSHRLHPSILDDLGLRDALEFLCNDVTRAHGLEVRFDAGNAPAVTSTEIASCLYRIAQESLRNAVKYAKADTVTVRLAAEGAAVTLAIIDSGAGFDTTASKIGLGLHSMRERASLVGGTVTIESHPGLGTTVVVTVPLNPGPEGAAGERQ